MTHQSEIKDTNIKTFALNDLVLSKLNPRQNVSNEEIAELAESIKICNGLIQNLSGFQVKKGDKVQIVAGGRRLRALQFLAANGGFGPYPVPVAITDREDIAKVWAVAENTARKDLNPVDEIIAFRAMSMEGKSIAQIAAIFATTEQTVYKRLALAALPDAAMEAIRDGSVSLSFARILTIAKDETLILEAVERIKNRGFFNEYSLKNFVLPQAISDGDHRILAIGEEAYVAAGGQITHDLFEDEKHYTDIELIDRLVSEKLASDAADLVKSGWNWAEVPSEELYSWEIEKHAAARVYPIEGVFTDDEADEYERLSELEEGEGIDDAGVQKLRDLEIIQKGDYSPEQRNLSGCFVQLSRDGSVEVFGGIVSPEDVAAAVEAGLVVKPREKVKADPLAMSQALCNDLTRARTTGFQTGFLDKTDLLLDLLAYHLGGHYKGEAPMALRQEIVDNQPTTETGFVKDDRLEQPCNTWSSPKGKQMNFATFQKKGKKHRNTVLADKLVKLVSFHNDDLTKELAQITEATLRDVMTPTFENFFKRVKSAALVSYYTEIMGVHGDPSFAGWKKKAQAEALHEIFNDSETQKHLAKEIIERIKTWEPKG